MIKTLLVAATAATFSFGALAQASAPMAKPMAKSGEMAASGPMMKKEKKMMKKDGMMKKDDKMMKKGASAPA